MHLSEKNTMEKDRVWATVDDNFLGVPYKFYECNPDAKWPDLMDS